MTSGSIGSHRAFMGVCITLCLCLVLTLLVGWRWYFESLSKRHTLIELAEKNEKRDQELGNLGLSLQAGKTEVPPASVLPKVTAPETATASAITSSPPSGSVSTEPPPNISHPAESRIKVLSLDESGEDVVQALALLDRYWQTENWKDRVPLVAHSERVAALMKDFYETQGGQDPEPGGLVSKARYQIDDTEILYFSYTSNRPTGSLEVAMLRGPDQKFLIDWESLIGYGEMSFRDFRAKRPTEPVTMRAYVRLFEYYNYEFSDSKKYLCIKLTSENGESSVYAYCDQRTELARWLDRDLAATGPSGFKGYTMLVSFPPDAQSNQCVILNRVIAPRWLTLR
ncbi:hypothetical protein [Prosthecobacter sp.]|uniref:hypothetical protein n=1 Tax=Prosthecobacter sp. TaxID=1965333 RepID=UPI001D902685|nr:hypothetical protein [Prosthecobacter sp.]MCB1278479.1 hypothetical protein [Prosthecobacter sp.]